MKDEQTEGGAASFRLRRTPSMDELMLVLPSTLAHVVLVL